MEEKKHAMEKREKKDKGNEEEEKVTRANWKKLEDKERK
jgi:hypothetical protein